MTFLVASRPMENYCSVEWTEGGYYLPSLFTCPFFSLSLFFLLP